MLIREKRKKKVIYCIDEGCRQLVKTKQKASLIRYKAFFVVPFLIRFEKL